MSNTNIYLDYIHDIPVVGIGEARFYLFIKSRGLNWWRFRLYEETENIIPRTAWINLDKPEHLRTSHKAKALRDILEREYQNTWREIIEGIIGIIQDNIELWIPKEEEEKEKPEKVNVDPRVEEEAIRILESETPLMLIKEHLDNLIAGETSNKLTIFLLLLSGKCKNPRLKQMIVLKGNAGAGKTTLMIIADLFKTKSVGRFTEHALDYTELKSYEILKLKEIGLMDEEKQGVSTLKFLSSEDEGYIVEFTVRDPETHEFTTKRKTIPPITVISSTTRVELDPQYSRRNWILGPDESDEQTLRIAEWIEKYEREQAEVILGLREETSFDFSKKALKYAVEKINPYDVIIPFTRTLMEILEHKKLRVRGDYKKIIALVKFYNILLQNQLPKVNGSNSKAIISTPQSALETLKIAEGPLVSTTTELPERLQKILNILEDFGVTERGASINQDLRNEIATLRGISEHTTREYLNELKRKGLFSDDGKRPKTFYLLHDMDTIHKMLSIITSKLQIEDVLLYKMRKEAQKWLNTLSSNENREVYSNISEIINAYPNPEFEESTLKEKLALFEKGWQKQPQSTKLRFLNESKDEKRDLDRFFQTCFICGKTLREIDSTTFEEGKPCHVGCLRKMKEARK